MARAGAGGDPAPARRVELLYFDDCPNYETLLPHLIEPLRGAGASDEVELRRISDDEVAQRERFLGSPTVGVDGHDVEPGASERRDVGPYAVRTPANASRVGLHLTLREAVRWRAMGEVDRTWKVGELAATGLTIRALHHYDDIGLLVPGRTESGHRVYSRADVERLYRVLALRGVGMALEEIAAVLDDDSVSLMDTVRRHVAAVERDIKQRRRLLERLLEMLDARTRSTSPCAPARRSTSHATSSTAPG